MNSTFMAGAAQQVITPPLGLHLVGWSARAAGDSLARYVHDDLYVKAVVVEQGGQSGALIVADLVGVDMVTAERIRRGIAADTALDPATVLICATHCHSGPAICPVAAAVNHSEIPAVQADGTMQGAYGQAAASVASGAYYLGEADAAWKDFFVSQAIKAAVAAWQSRRAAEVAFAEAEVEGVASSRRVFLSDGSWADPRRANPAAAAVVSRTEIDPHVRVMLVREAHSAAPLAMVMNYGCHPWVFSASAYSAEIPGAAAQSIAATWCAPGGKPPIVLHTSGPAGDVTAIWNIDIENVWLSRPGESPADSLARREKAFDSEIQRMSRRLVTGVEAAIGRAQHWDAQPTLNIRRRRFALPLKPGYHRPPEVVLADWQMVAPEGQHLTEAHLLQLGAGAILALPGELFVSLGRRLRDWAPVQHLLIATIASDYGPFNYLADAGDYELGGYELVLTPAAPEAGAELVRQAARLFEGGA